MGGPKLRLVQQQQGTSPTTAAARTEESPDLLSLDFSQILEAPVRWERSPLPGL